MKIDKYNTELPARSQVLAQVGTPEFYTQLNELKNLGYQIFDPMKLKH